MNQSDAVRLLYLHVPTATFFYVAFSVTALGSVLWLWKKSVWWDLVAAASAEIGVLFTGVTLVVGALWGRTTWGTYWDWDPRLTTTALLFLIFLGYLAVRRLPADIHTRDTRARRRRPSSGSSTCPSSTSRSTGGAASTNGPASRPST